VTAAQTFRPYQERAYRAACDAYRAGHRALVLVSPTGSGKTTIGARFVVNAERKGNACVWLAHREELIDQARDRLLSEGVKRVGVIAADRPTMNAPVQVASLETLVERMKKGLPPAKVVVFDEVQHAAADTYREIVLHYRAQGAAILGLTATPERGDGRGLGGDLFDTMIHVASVRELQALGFLVPIVTYSPSTYQKELSMDPVACYLARTPNERCFVYVLNVPQAERLTLAFGAAGVAAATIHGDTPQHLRKARLQAFKLQSRQPLLEAGYNESAPLVLVNCYVLTEGVDVPEATHCILARGCGHAGIMLQMAGRVMRPAQGKARAVLSDLRGCTRRPSIGVPESDREWSLEGKASKLSSTETERPLLTCPACDATVSTWTADRDGWRICPVCRERISAPEPLVVKQRKQHMFGAEAPPERKFSQLVALAHTAAKRGFKPGWASFRYRELFGTLPPRADLAQARDLADRALGADVIEAARINREHVRAERAARDALALEAAAKPRDEHDHVGGDIDSDEDRAAWQRVLDEQARCG
jgi:superfamily II DNA or RNA helicase